MIPNRRKCLICMLAPEKVCLWCKDGWCDKHFLLNYKSGEPNCVGWGVEVWGVGDHYHAYKTVLQS